MVWKKVNNNHTGFKITFGGNDIDKISSYFDGTGDVDDVDIDSSTTFRSGKFAIRNANNTAQHNIATSAITGNVTLTLPLMTSNQYFMFENFPDVMDNKTFTNCVFQATESGTANAKLSGIGVDPSVMRWGSGFPIGDITNNPNASLEGLLSNHTVRVPSGGAITLGSGGFNYSGLYFMITTPNNAAGEYCGIISPTTGIGPFRMSHDGLIHLRWAVSRTTGDSGWFHCGLSSSSSAPLNMTTPLGVNDSGIIIGTEVYGGLSHNGVHAYYNNGGGTAATKTLIGDMSDIDMGDIQFNDMEIKWWNFEGTLTAITNVRSSVPGSTLNTITLNSSKLPAANTNLYFHCHLINEGIDDKGLQIAGLWVESK